MKWIPIDYRAGLFFVLSFMVSNHNIFAQYKESDPARHFSTMTQDEVKEYELDIWRRIADLSLIPPKINSSPLPEYDYDQLDYGMTIGIARTPAVGFGLHGLVERMALRHLW